MVPLVRELDPSAGPLQFFGAELRRARTAAGLSQDQLGQRLGYSGAQVGKVETGERAPSPRTSRRPATRRSRTTGGLFGRLYQLARRWDGGYPSWFAEWVDSERRATSLRWWEPLLIPGLLQTADYARAILAADPETTEDQLDELVAARLERQSDPRSDRTRRRSGWCWMRPCCTGSSGRARSCMTSCCTWPTRRAAATSPCRSCPLEIGAHAGLLGGFAIASFDNAPGTVYMESPDQGQTTELPSVVRRLSLTFDTLRADALPRGASRDLIGKVAEERWATP